jgi:hypothetical protein
LHPHKGEETDETHDGDAEACDGKQTQSGKCIKSH